MKWIKRKDKKERERGLDFFFCVKKMATVSVSFARGHGGISTQRRYSSNRFPTPKLPSQLRINCCSFSSSSSSSSVREDKAPNDSFSPFKQLKSVGCGLLIALVVSAASPVIAAGQRLPPLSTDPERCNLALVGNTIGQANGVYDKVIDLRFCDFSNEKLNLKGKSLASALMSEAKFDGADMTEVVMSKAYAIGASFKGTDFTNAVLDRVNFGKANLTGAIFKNTVLSGSTFDDALLQDVVFEDTIIGYIDLQKLCRNTSISDDNRTLLGCR